MKKTKVWMKVCDQYGPSIHGVSEKYREFAPTWVEWVEDWIDADLTIDHLIGTPDRANLVNPYERSFSEEVKTRLALAEMGDKKVSYVLHCSIVDDQFFRDLFRECIVATGFLDVPSIVKTEEAKLKYQRVSWGVDTCDFLLPLKNRPDPKYLIYTWGCSHDPNEEHIETVYQAVRRAGGKMLHSGVDYRFDSGKSYVYVPPARTRAEVAQRYNQCVFANAMRVEDGFELANVEAPLSNCLPITLMKPCYWHFFKDLSIFVDESLIHDELYQIFANRNEFLLHMTLEYKKKIIERFRWADTCRVFWDSIGQSLSEEVLGCRFGANI